MVKLTFTIASALAFLSLASAQNITTVPTTVPTTSPISNSAKVSELLQSLKSKASQNGGARPTSTRSNIVLNAASTQGLNSSKSNGIISVPMSYKVVGALTFTGLWATLL